MPPTGDRRLLLLVENLNPCESYTFTLKKSFKCEPVDFHFKTVILPLALLATLVEVLFRINFCVEMFFQFGVETNFQLGVEMQSVIFLVFML